MKCNAFVLAVLTLSASSAADSAVDVINESRKLTDIPYPSFRFKSWQMLTTDEKELATILDYNPETWNAPGTSFIETKSFSKLGPDEQVAAENMGFNKEQWDCYQNHYASYDWSQLRSSDLIEPLTRLGWSKDSWQDRDEAKPNSEAPEWKKLTSNQMKAAREICYFQETWNNVGFDEWECRRDHYQDYTWDQLVDEGVVQYFETLGWTHAKWHGTDEGPPASASKTWNELSSEEHIAARKLCYYKEEWNGPPYPTFRYRAWEFLTDEQKGFAQDLSYSAATWNTIGSEDIETLAFDELSTTQKELAMNLGYSDEVWDCYINHYEGYSWEDLYQEGVQHYFVVLGWNSNKWQEGKSANSEDIDWVDLNPAQKTAAREICYIEQSWDETPLNQWDCAKDHFYDKSWSDLKEMGIQQYFVTLGWDHTAWRTGEAPSTEDESWDMLSKDEEAAARAICFEKAEWNGPSDYYPSSRFHMFELLDEGTISNAKTLGYVKETWNNPGTAAIEDMIFTELNTDQQVAAQKLGYEDETWDCWQNHYSGYSWDQLKNYDVVRHFELLGWNRNMWDTKSKPDSWKKDWAELTAGQRTAAEKLCYFDETWQRINLADWDCPTKHFTGYSWDGLNKAGVQIYFITLGWTEETWKGGKGSTTIDDLHWDQLTTEEHTAAQQICYTKSMWESKFTPNGAVYPEFRFRNYASLSPKLKEYAETLSYTKSTWNNLGTAIVESLSYSDLSPDEQHAVIQLGFASEEDWDCYMNHYDDYTWEELEQEEVQTYFTMLGYDKDGWNGESHTPSAVEDLHWNELTAAQQTAAKKICYIEESWEGTPLTEWECSWDHFHSRDWSELEDIGVQQYMTTLGWDKKSWESGADAPTSEFKRWNDLTTGEEGAARAICFQKEEWDGPSAFYPIYRYQLWELADKSVKRAAITLGYDSETWNNPGSADIEYKTFDELSELEQAAARSLEFREDTWNCWQNHYFGYYWDDINEAGLMSNLVPFGWTEKAWNAYDGSNGRLTAPDTWRTEWDDLSEIQWEAAVDLCYIEETWQELNLEDWDCSQTHFAGYDWDELAPIGVQGYFVTLGWTRQSWHGNAPAPSSDTQKWADLNEQEQIAARQVCFTKSVWDSSLGGANGGTNGRDKQTHKGKKNVGGIIGGILAAFVVVGIVGGLFLSRNMKSDKSEDLVESVPNEEAVQV
eukprot:CAMPEP_0195284650 /NCGR_PEP_ID=MMETSP0707-20130614/2778_1 /TAXON_ID=33640 /ORGANISM="Asterionellopsis glacialis, Strain CCMP134" /LENGTH=1190 /DNA_ID=CAMNT_0040344029 /DNA_START=45 /DNA_END=3617 /DNA_ORIENTATION=-